MASLESIGVIRSIGTFTRITEKRGTKVQGLGEAGAHLCCSSVETDEKAGIATSYRTCSLGFRSMFEAEWVNYSKAESSAVSLGQKGQAIAPDL